MGKTSIKSALVGAVTFFCIQVAADRACSSNASSPFAWRVSDARFDGADPNVSDAKAVVAVSSRSIQTHLTLISCRGDTLTDKAKSSLTIPIPSSNASQSGRNPGLDGRRMVT